MASFPRLQLLIFNMNASKVYFTQFEKGLVLGLMKSHLHIIECKETNAVGSVKKSKTYIEIAWQFNEVFGGADSDAATVYAH
ncbi:hypothetical protein TNCT_52651 [Trichonephila clavata]|uniref:Regulatory protein zeste n=1 Tax=Trichonephila clavata TaxID=2740835 RepID=A0A8X6FIB7_TRICU|nr:hypothetical protein TNCT_52651 [Trichonephila clavata]